jgi:hypothetical protein
MAAENIWRPVFVFWVINSGAFLFELTSQSKQFKKINLFSFCYFDDFEHLPT